MREEYIKKIEQHKSTTPIYELSLDIGVCETTLRKYLYNSYLNSKTVEKIENYVKNNF